MATERRTIRIRERQEADLVQLGELLKLVHELDGYPVEGVGDPIAWLTSDRPLGAWVAELDDEIAGQVILSQASDADDAAQIWRAQSSEVLESISVVGRLFVGPQARGHRLGQRLAITATTYAESLGMRAVLDVMAKDRAAIRIYESLGWRRLAAINHRFNDKSEPGFAYVSPPASTDRSPSSHHDPSA